MTKITSFTTSMQPEGMRITYTYSIIDENGNVTKQNVRATCIVMDDSINTKISDIQQWLLNKITV